MFEQCAKLCYDTFMVQSYDKKRFRIIMKLRFICSLKVFTVMRNNFV